MKTLILTCSTGEGHNSCAAAIKEAFDLNGMPCDVVDALGLISDKASSFICNWHTRIYRYIPRLFCSGYSFAESHPGLFDDRKLVYKYLASGADQLLELVKREEYDTIVNVHAFSAIMTLELRKKYGVRFRSCFLSTDYTCSPSVADCCADLYFIPHAGLLEEFIACGIPREKLAATGMPVRLAFHAHTEKAAAKARLGLEDAQQHVLMMCGSMGCGPMEALARQLERSMPENAVLTVVCGTNEKLYDALSRLDGSRVRALGYTRDIPLLMDSADLFITKPGGISISEAAAKGLPMLFVDTVGGCEAHNMEYFLKNGWAVTAGSTMELARACVDLLEDPAALSDMSQRLSAAFPDKPAEEIFRCLFPAAEKKGDPDGK